MNKGLLSVVLCYILWGVLPLFWKLLGAVDPVYVLCARILFSCAAYWVISAARGKWGLVREALRQKRRIALAFLSGALLSLNWGTFIWAVSSGHVLDSSLGYYINPLMVIVIAAGFFHEKLSRLEWTAVALAAVGVFITVAATGALPWISLLLACTFTAYGTVKKAVDLDSETALFLEMLMVVPFAAAYLIYAEATGTGASGILSGAQFLLLPAAGIVTAVPLILFSDGVRRAPYYLVGIVSFIGPTLQFFCGLLTGEPFTPIRAVTFCFIWTGIALVIADKLRRRSIPAALPAEKSA